MSIFSTELGKHYILDFMLLFCSDNSVLWESAMCLRVLVNSLL